MVADHGCILIQVSAQIVPFVTLTSSLLKISHVFSVESLERRASASKLFLAEEASIASVLHKKQAKTRQNHALILQQMFLHWDP